MATLEQLQAEQWWSREIVTSPMMGLGLQLRAAYNTGATSFGTKGNAAHLRGAHRSQEWIKNSEYCTNRSYTVQDGLTALQARYIGGFDFTPGAWGTPDNRSKMRVLTKRMIDAMRAGRLPEVLQVFGTLDGATVTGWDNTRDVAISADNSHLDHIHGGIDRAKVDDNDVMARIAAVMLGKDNPMDPMYTEQYTPGWFAQAIAEMTDTISIPPAVSTKVSPAYAGYKGTNKLAAILRDIDAQTSMNGDNIKTALERLAAVQTAVGNVTVPAPAAVDESALAAALAPLLAQTVQDAAEAAVRKVLGTLDGATPSGS